MSTQFVFGLICVHYLIPKFKGTASIKMREIHPSNVKATSFTCSLVRQRRVFTFVRHYASREVSCGILTKVCKARINYLKLLYLLHYPLTV